MKFKINRRWRHWKNDDERTRKAVVGSERGPLQTMAPSSGGDITSSSKRFKRNFSSAKPNATSDKIYDAGKELYNNNNIVDAKNLNKNQKPVYSRHGINEFISASNRVSDKLYAEKGENKESQKLDSEVTSIDDF